MPQQLYKHNQRMRISIQMANLQQEKCKHQSTQYKMAHTHTSITYISYKTKLSDTSHEHNQVLNNQGSLTSLVKTDKEREKGSDRIADYKSKYSWKRWVLRAVRKEEILLEDLTFRGKAFHISGAA